MAANKIRRLDGEEAAMMAVGAAIHPLQCELYVASVLSLYVEMPDTPARATALDRDQARRLLDEQVPLEIVETALVLASLRRLMRPPNVASLPRIRSLAYFQPVIEEVRRHRPGHGYLAYLRRRLAECTVARTGPVEPAAGA